MNDTLNKTLIRGHEGYRLKAYDDSRGFMSIGVGLNLDAPGAGTLCAKANVNYPAIRAGAALRPDQVDALFELQYEEVAAAVRKMFPQVDSYPDNAAAVICDMRFELGESGFLKFHNTDAAFLKQDWAGAIAGIQDSALASEVPGRVANNVALLQALIPTAKAA